VRSWRRIDPYSACSSGPGSIPQALAQRIGVDEGLDLRHELGVEAEVEVRLDPLFQDPEPEILEAADLVLGEVLQLRVRQGWSPPEPQRRVELRRPGRGLRSSCTADEVFEARQVELAAVELQNVAAGTGLDEAGAEELPQLRDRVLQRRRRRARRMLAPELGHEPFGRERLVRPQKQKRQQCALVPPDERDGGLPVEDLEGPKDPEFEHAQRL
jgi:hypothetical protein